MGSSRWTLGSPAHMKSLGRVEVEPGFFYFEQPITGYIDFRNMR